MYWLLILGVTSISTMASIYHGKFTPALWGWLFSGILYFTEVYMEPVLFGWMQYAKSDTNLFYLSLTMSFLVLFQVALLLSNSIKKGEVWA